MKENRKAIIMGATSGIGLEVCKVLTGLGWKVGIAGRREEILTQLAAENENIVATARIDITKDDAPMQLEQLIESMGGVDLYFHSSGIGYQNPSLDMNKEIATVETNAVGFTRMIDFIFNYYANHTENKSQIAVISSIAGTKGLGAAPSYSATKRYVSHYLESLTQLCRIRKIRNISIHDIRPGFVQTPLLGDGGNYPMQLDAHRVAELIVKGVIEKRRQIVIVDWRYRLLVYFWRLIPRWLWVRMSIVSTKV